MEAKELTAKEIFNTIMRGERVYLPTRDFVIIENLKNHLNVLKSQAKKTFKELGFEFKNSVIKIDNYIREIKLKQVGNGVPENSFIIREEDTWSVVYLVAAKPSQKYSTFIIGNNDQPIAGASKTGA